MAYDTHVRAKEDGAVAPTSLMKTCPRCGAMVFADMDVCYGCLYDFTRPGLAYPGSGTGSTITCMARAPDDAEPVLRATSTASVGRAAETRSESEEAPASTETPQGGDEGSHGGAQPAATSGDRSHAMASKTHSAPASTEEASKERLEAPPKPTEAPTGPKQRLSASSAEPTAAMAQAAVAEAPPMAAPAEAEDFPSEKPEVEEVPDEPMEGGRFYLRVRWRGMEVLVPLEGRPLAIGRLPQSEIVLSDFTVCDEHATIALSGERARVALIDRRARATKDGVEVEGSTELSAGEELDIAGARFALVRRERRP